MSKEKNNPVYNFIEVMMYLANGGDTNKYSKKTYTSINKSLNNLKSIASPKFSNLPDFDIETNCNIKIIKEMLKEFKLVLQDDSHIYNVVPYYYDDTHSTTCEICQSSHNCAHIYTVINKKTLKTLQSGSQCIKKLEIPVYIDGKKVKPEELQTIFRQVEEDYKKFTEEKNHTTFEMCLRNNNIILEHMKEVGDKIPNVGASNYNNEIIRLSNCIYTLYRDKLADRPIDIEAKKEADMTQQLLYSWSRNMGENLDYVTFIPGVNFCLNNKLTYTGRFKIVLSYMQAQRFIKEKVDYDYIASIVSQLKAYNIDDYFNVFRWIKNKATNFVVRDDDVIAFVISLCDVEDEDIYNIMIKSFTNWCKQTPKYTINLCTKIIDLVDNFKNKESEVYKQFLRVLKICNEAMEEVGVLAEEKKKVAKSVRDYKKIMKARNLGSRKTSVKKKVNYE
jgi:hypothetical protein